MVHCEPIAPKHRVFADGFLAPTGSRDDLPTYPRIAGYDILGELGRGGMGVVYKARQHQLGRLVAIKTIQNHDSCDRDTQRRFRREMQAATRLSHPNIITVYGSGQVDDVCYLVMQFIDGIDLERQVQDSGPLPIDQACDYVRQVALGLQHAHEQGMVHRDIKPANLMVTDVEGDKVVKILDMGLARLYGGEGASSLSRLTCEGTIVGTPDYMAPEQVDNSHTVDIRADLYSLGCTFYFLLTGWVPFPCRSPLETLDRHRWARPTRPERVRREVPRAIGDIVVKLMAKRPEDRYQTPAALIAALQYLANAPSNPEIDLPVLSVEQELDRLRFALADHLERNELTQARGILDAMFRVKPNDSLAVSVGAFIEQETVAQQPVGECRRFDKLGDCVWSVAFSPDGQRVAAAVDKLVQVWDTQSGCKVSSGTGHRDAVKCVIFSGDGQRILSASRDRTIRLWDVRRGREVRGYSGHASPVECVALSPQGGQLASCAGKSIRLWDIDSGQRLRRFGSHAGEVKCVAFSPDGKYLLSGSWDHSVRLWDVDSGLERRRFDGSMNLFTSVAVSPDGRCAAAAGSDACIYLWHIDSGRELGRLTGHSSWVTSAAFSPDGRRLLSASHDQTLRLWDIDSGRELHTFEGHSNWINCAQISADGRLALSGDSDGIVRLWRLPR